MKFISQHQTSHHFTSFPSLHADQLSAGVLQSVLEILLTQIQRYLDNGGCQSGMLANFLVFVRRVVSNNKVQRQLANKKWTDVLMSVISQPKPGG